MALSALSRGIFFTHNATRHDAIIHFLSDVVNPGPTASKFDHGVHKLWYYHDHSRQIRVAQA